MEGPVKWLELWKDVCIWMNEECQTPAPGLTAALSHHLRALYNVLQVLPLYDHVV